MCRAARRHLHRCVRRQRTGLAYRGCDRLRDGLPGLPGVDPRPQGSARPSGLARAACAAWRPRPGRRGPARGSAAHARIDASPLVKACALQRFKRLQRFRRESRPAWAPGGTDRAAQHACAQALSLTWLRGVARRRASAIVGLAACLPCGQSRQLRWPAAGHLPAWPGGRKLARIWLRARAGAVGLSQYQQVDKALLAPRTRGRRALARGQNSPRSIGGSSEVSGRRDSRQSGWRDGCGVKGSPARSPLPGGAGGRTRIEGPRRPPKASPQRV